MLVGKSKSSTIFSIVRLSSFTVGPAGDNGAFAYAPKENWTEEEMVREEIKIKEIAKKAIKGLCLLIIGWSNNIKKYFNLIKVSNDKCEMNHHYEEMSSVLTSLSTHQDIKITYLIVEYGLIKPRTRRGEPI
jgi:hypothetical protein